MDMEHCLSANRMGKSIAFKSHLSKTLTSSYYCTYFNDKHPLYTKASIITNDSTVGVIFMKMKI